MGSSPQEPRAGAAGDPWRADEPADSYFGTPAATDPSWQLAYQHNYQRPYAPPPPPSPASPPATNAWTHCTTCGHAIGRLPFCSYCGMPTVYAPAMGYTPTGQPTTPPVQRRVYRTVQLRDLLPLDSWVRDGVWWRGRLALFLACAVTPFLLLQATVHDVDVRHAAWGFSIYFAVIWLVAIRALIRPEPVSIARQALVIAMTAVIGVSVAITLEHRLAANTSTLMRSIITIGIPEEVAKALPLLLVLLTLQNQIGPKTYLYLGAVSGLTFGVVESMAYTALYSNGIEQTGDSALVTGIIWRLLTDSLFHAALAGIVGVFIGFAAIAQRQQVTFVMIGLALAAVLHGAYDRTAGHWPGVVIAAVVMLLFAGYIKTADDITRVLAPDRS